MSTDSPQAAGSVTAPRAFSSLFDVTPFSLFIKTITRFVSPFTAGVKTETASHSLIARQQATSFENERQVEGRDKISLSRVLCATKYFNVVRVKVKCGFLLHE